MILRYKKPQKRFLDGYAYNSGLTLLNRFESLVIHLSNFIVFFVRIRDKAKEIQDIPAQCIQIQNKHNIT